MYDAARKFNIRDVSNSLSGGKFRFAPHGFRAAVKVFPAGFRSRLHIHDFPQLWYCLEGQYQHQTAEGLHTCREGTLTLIPPGCPDGFRIPDPGSARLACISLSPALFPDIPAAAYSNALTRLFLPNYADALPLPFPCHTPLDTAAQQAFEAALTGLCALSGSPETVTPVQILDPLEAFFSRDAFRLPDNCRQEALELLESRVLPILKALNYINAHFAQRLTVEDMTRVTALCQTNFFRHFKILTGISFSDYVQQRRVAEVTFLIGNTDHSFTYISGLCGFSDPAHMTKVFTRYTGRPPRVGRPKLQAYYTDQKKTGED